MMDSNCNLKGHTRSQMPAQNLKSNYNKVDDASSRPTFVLFWIWNWLATLPKTVTNLYADFKSGELLSRFTLLDAMLQFIVAVATSCHPQGTSDEGYEADECTTNGDMSSSKSKKEVKPFEEILQKDTILKRNFVLGGLYVLEQ